MKKEQNRHQMHNKKGSRTAVFFYALKPLFDSSKNLRILASLQ